MKVEERLTTESAIVNGYILKGLCTIGRDGKATDEMGCPEFCEISDGDCNNCPIQEAFTRLAEYENTGLSPAEIEGIKNKDTAVRCKDCEYAMCTANGYACKRIMEVTGGGDIYIYNNAEDFCSYGKRKENKDV